AVGGGAGAGGVGEPQGSLLVEVAQDLDLVVQGVGEGAGSGGVAGEAVAFGGVGGGFGLGGPAGGAVAVGGGGLEGAGELVGDVAGCPGLVAFVGAHAHAELAVAHLGLVAVGVGAAECAPRGAPGGVGLGLSRRGRGGDRRGVVGVAGEFAVGGDRGGAVTPGLALGGTGRDGTEGLDRPRRRVGYGLIAEFIPASVGVLCQRTQVTVPVGVVGDGDPVGEPFTSGVEAQAVGDPGAQHVGDDAGGVDLLLGDGRAEHHLGVVAGEFGAAQDATQAGGGVLGGQPGALVAGEGAVVDELVEQGRGPGGDDAGGLVGEQLTSRA